MKRFLHEYGLFGMHHDWYLQSEYREYESAHTGDLLYMRCDCGEKIFIRATYSEAI